MSKVIEKSQKGQNKRKLKVLSEVEIAIDKAVTCIQRVCATDGCVDLIDAKEIFSGHFKPEWNRYPARISEFKRKMNAALIEMGLLEKQPAKPKRKKGEPKPKEPEAKGQLNLQGQIWNGYSWEDA